MWSNKNSHRQPVAMKHDTVILEDSWKFLTKLVLPYNPAIILLIFNKMRWKLHPHKNLHTNVHSCCVYHEGKCETIRIALSRWTDKPAVLLLYPCNRKLLSSEKEKILVGAATWMNWAEASSRGYLLSNSVCTTFLKRECSDGEQNRGFQGLQTWREWRNFGGNGRSGWESASVP